MKWVKDERGFSLIEMMVVIAIMGILTGFVFYGIHMVRGKEVEECAKKLTSQLQKTRTETMGKYKMVLEITKNEKDQVVVNKKTTKMEDDGSMTETQDSVVVGKSGVAVYYSTSDLAVETQITKEHSLVIEFDRGTGALAKTNHSAETQKQCRRIRIEKNAKMRTITLVPVTGNISCD